MPLADYFAGKGKKVMGKMKDQYGEKQGEKVFHATANKHKGKFQPSDSVKKKHSLK